MATRTDGLTPSTRALRAVGVVALVFAIPALLLGQLLVGPDRFLSLAELFGGGDTPPDVGQPVAQLVQLRLPPAVNTAAVGASLGLSGALLQGLFRNGLAAPSLIGVTSGAGLGATLATLVLGGYASFLGATTFAARFAPYLVSLSAFVCALAITLSILALAAGAGRGRISAANLLLVGVATNACLASAFAAIQALIKEDYEVGRAVLEWTFGRLDDRAWFHAGIATLGLVPGIAAIPFVATELDLLAGGEDDARTLGVSVDRVRAITLGAAAWTAACAVSAAGQIAFVGLMVPHFVRLLVGSSHRRVLWLAPLVGAVFLLGTDLLLKVLLDGRRQLPPGVMTSLLGAPFLVFLLLRGRRSGEAAW
jgi:iron complex transport system permease protein